VTINPAALQQLAGIAPPPIPVFAAPAPPVVHHARQRHLAILLVRPAAPMVAKPLPPKPVPVVARVPAPAVLAPVTLMFAEGSADLPASAAPTLKPYCRAGGVLAIDARAAGDPSDPSVAMRLSLARAMAVRGALVSCGVPAANIIPRALGQVPGVNNDETQLAPAK
jgi:hypothetical protein